MLHAIEGLEEERELVVGDAVGGLGAVGEPLYARERQRHEVDARRRGGRRATLPGVETKDTWWPRDARRSASSRYGSRCPNASHGKITMRSGRWQSAAWTEQAAELDGDAAGGAGGGQS